MEAILVDSTLLGVSPASDTFTPGIVFIVPKSVFLSLSNLPLGNARISFIHSDQFKKSIKEQYSVSFNPEKALTLIGIGCLDYIQPILNSFSSGFPKETTIWVCLDIQADNFLSKLTLLANSGFTHPYITNKSPDFKSITPSVALTRSNYSPYDPNTCINSSATLNSIIHLLEQFKKNDGVCFLFTQFSPDAVKFLNKASHMGRIEERGKSSQKEITGELYIQDVINKNGVIVYVISVAEESIKSGDEENVDVSATRYNFHSHPKDAYIRHNVEKAWPSSTDYLGYLQLGRSTIFHCVATIEGVYILSFTPHWANRLKSIDKKFVESNYDINHSAPLTPEQYVRKVNSILYKGYPIYNVQFFEWKDATAPFKVFFPQIESSCLVSQTVLETHKQLYEK